MVGAAGGLGGAIALELVRAGGQVVAGDVDAAGLRRLRSEAAGLPGRLVVAPLDVADEASVTTFFAAAATELGGANGLINAAGVLGDGLLVSHQDGEIRRLPAVLWRRVLDVNLTGSFLAVREFAVQALERNVGEAFVVNFSSLSRGGNPGQANYAASKAGIDAATRTWALELAPLGIRVAAVAPGVVDTPFLRQIAPEALARLEEAVPLGRVGTPRDVWLAVRFVIECSYFTGRVLEVDGGAAMASTSPAAERTYGAAQR